MNLPPLPVPPDPPIPFNRPLLLDEGLAYVRAAFANGHVSGDGGFTRRCQDFFDGYLAPGRTLLTTSCTDALELSALLLDVGPGDDVIVPSFTFVSTANAFVLRGARPVFADIRPDTYNLDEAQLAGLLTPRTKAIAVVHYGGVSCEMDVISPLAAERGISVIEDNAHGLFGTYRDRKLGTFGRLSTLSFHETKNLSCGEGGALVVNDPQLAGRAEVLREKGTDRSRFFRGEIDKYTWRDIGSSFLPSDILAALLWAQVEAHEVIQERRREIHDHYAGCLADWARGGNVGFQSVPPACRSSHHLFSLLLPTPGAQQAFLRHLKARGVNAVFHYQPLHLTPMGRSLGGRPGQCPVAESVSGRIARLPFYFDLNRADQDRVIEAVLSFTP